ncbi:hypothetical protein [Sporosarcina limicola]|uniref:Uncharacterized protein n=1 Tax=Sporosarcina limicola TaxID=34101 RepID=A0A927MN46_9BACL|nr:hypothetical protein [Sporosarcina limicola]MBE1554514.1 hypothetical protein [Sporosarcina limicola]
MESVVNILTMKTLENKELFKEGVLITEIDFDPKDRNVIYYLLAETFENYSPIAGVNPHEFDLYSYRILENVHSRHTELNKYSMQSLNVSSTGGSALVQMDDDVHAETAEDLFASKQRIFEVSLDSSDAISMVSNIDRAEDIYDFVLIPNKDEVIFQSVGNTDEQGIFEYELYHYNWKSDQEKQLTNLKESASRPVIGPQNEKVFFMVDKRFGKKRADYHLYQMDLDGKDVEEITLDLGSD